MLIVAEEIQLPVQQARAGDSAAWEVLFKRYQLPLYVYVFELVRDEQVGLDIVQETFINAARYIRSLQEDEKFGSWLFSIAHQKCVQQWRKNAKEKQWREEDVLPEPEVEDGPAELLIRKEQEEEFMNLIASLPAPHRSVLLLYFVEDFSLEQIAAITESQLGTVKSRMHYAKRALRKLLEEGA
jgi:RNA polymerase sigma-70 factor (ECF subfamily)